MFYFTKEKWKVTSGNFKEMPDGVYKCEKVKRIRNLWQNRLYWWWLWKVSEFYEKEIWEIKTPEELHEYYKNRFLRYREYSEFNKRKYVVKIWSTSDLLEPDFARYLNILNKVWQEELQWTPPVPINKHELEAFERLGILNNK